MSRRHPSADTSELAAASRLERLSSAVSRLGPRFRLDVDRAQLLGGAALLVLGMLVILLGWWGAANTGFLFEQVPYLISGGLLGLGLAIAGGFLYFAYWVTRLIRESREQAERSTQALGRLEALLAEGTSGNGARSSRDSRTPRSSRSSQVRASSDGTLWATARGTMFHRRDCSVVSGRNDLRRVRAGAPGMEPCRICDPLAG